MHHVDAQNIVHALHEIRDAIRAAAGHTGTLRHSVSVFTLQPAKGNPMPKVQLPPLDCPLNDDVLWSIVPEDVSGVPVPDTLTFTSSDPTKFVATPQADGLSCLFVRQPGAAAGDSVTFSVSDPSGNEDDVIVNVVAIPPGPPAQFVSNIGVVPSARP